MTEPVATPPQPGEIGARELLDAVIESVPQAILATGRDDRVLACNRNAEFLFGLTRARMLGKPFQEALPKPVAQALQHLAVATLKGEGSVDQEFDYALESSGTTLHLGITSTLLSGPAGTPMGLLFILRDMSLSREVQKLRELDEMKSDFIHAVSHELKTPLTAILGGTELLAADKESLSADHQELVRIVDSGARRLHDLIMDLLKLSALESGKVTLEHEVFDLIDLVKEVADLAQGRNPKCPVRIDAPKRFPSVRADRNRVREALENFVTNALKYSPAGGQATVRLRAGAQTVTVEVEDQGMGIPARHLPFIWDKFYRVNSPDTARIEGTGLGLSIVKHIVEMHGGKVWVKSIEGKGSTFGFSLPT